MTIATKNNVVILKGGLAASDCGCCGCVQLCTDLPTEITISLTAPGSEGLPWEYAEASFAYRWGAVERRSISFPAVDYSVTIPWSKIASGSGNIEAPSGIVVGYGGGSPSDKCFAYVTLSQTTGTSLWDADTGQALFTGYAYETRSIEARVELGLGAIRPNVVIEQRWWSMIDSTFFLTNYRRRSWAPASNGAAECKNYQNFPLSEVVEGAGKFVDGVATSEPIEPGDFYRLAVGPFGGSGILQNKQYNYPPSDNQVRIGESISASVTIT